MNVAIVTGVAGGIGKACALALAQRGYHIVGMGRRSDPDLSEFESCSITYVSGDVSVSEDRQRLLDAAISKGDITVLVNEICPGIIETDMTADVKEKYDRLIENGLVPLGRWGQPEDIARAVVSLCDGTMGYMTGGTLILDGGMHIRRL